MSVQAFEVNFDGIVGPTHSYQGLSYGNVASMTHEQVTAYPKEAALQGLNKMKHLSDLGIRQGVLPPHERPHLPTLRRLGFHGSDADALEEAAKVAPHLLAMCSSASAMWTANALTMAPSADSLDGKVHLTPANLEHKFHRTIEAEVTERVLRAMFANEEFFTVHRRLPRSPLFGDEGAANHTRFCSGYGDTGLHMLVFGRKAFQPDAPAPKKFPARQTLEASQAIARLHQLPTERTLFTQQNPDVIDAGVFHNDVIATGNQNVFLFHENAFLNTSDVISLLDTKLKELCGIDLIPLMVPDDVVSVQDAVSSYLFNSQIVTLPDSSMAIIAPTECEENECVKGMLDQIVADPSNPIGAVEILDVRQSMQNGGGPACLRNRVVLTQDELAAVNPHVIFNETLYNQLTKWVEDHYRDELNLADLADPALLIESCTALEELTHILNLGPVYDFQK